MTNSTSEVLGTRSGAVVKITRDATYWSARVLDDVNAYADPTRIGKSTDRAALERRIVDQLGPIMWRQPALDL